MSSLSARDTLRAAFACTLLVTSVLLVGSCSPGDRTTAPRTGPLAGVVRDAFSDPVPGATVFATPVAGSWPAPTDTASGVTWSRITTTDAAGRFDLGLAEVGEWSVAAVSGDDAVVLDTIVVPAAAAALTLAPAGAARGQVRLAGLPTAGGVQVGCTLPWPLAVSEEDGAWLLRGLPAGTVAIRFRTPGFRDTNVTATSVVPGDTLVLPDITLQRDTAL